MVNFAAELVRLISQPSFSKYHEYTIGEQMTILKKFFNKKKYNKALSSKEWGSIYNISLVDSLVQSINEKNVSVWSKHLVDITNEGEAILEIGCGIGVTSVWLALHGRACTALVGSWGYNLASRNKFFLRFCCLGTSAIYYDNMFLSFKNRFIMFCKKIFRYIIKTLRGK